MCNIAYSLQSKYIIHPELLTIDALLILPTNILIKLTACTQKRHNQVEELKLSHSEITLFKLLKVYIFKCIIEL